MEIRLLDESFSQHEYNEAAHHPLQSWEWGEARKAAKTPITRFGEFDGKKLVNVFQMSLHPLASTPYTIGYIPRSVMPSSTAIDFFKRYGNKHKFLFVKFEPYVFKTDASFTPPKDLTPSPHPLFTAWTQVLDLTVREEELLKKMKPKTRYNIGLAERKGVTVREDSSEAGFETFIKLYFETCRRQHYFGHTLAYHRSIWSKLKKEISHLVIAEYQGTPLAAYELFKFKDGWYYVYGGTSDTHRNFMASNLLMWHAIRLGKKLGAKTFDLWGSLPPTYEEKNPWAGFTRFKEGYGTTYKETVGSFDLVLSPLLYPVYTLAQKIRNRLLSILPVN